MNACTDRGQSLDRGDQIDAHGVLQGAAELQHLGFLAGVDQAAFGLGHAFLQDHDDCVAVERRTSLGRSPSRVIAEDVHDRGGNGGSS